MMETDADRRNMLLALGGSSRILIDSTPVLGLFQREPGQSSFDEISINAPTYSLRCLMSDAKDVATGVRVEIPGDQASYFIASIHDEDGMALIELRKE